MTATVTDRTNPASPPPLSPPPPLPPLSPRRPVPSPAGLIVAAATGAVAVIGWWWADTGAIQGIGDWVTNAGRLTGLLAGYLLAILLLLMARVPVLERVVGADRLARWHAATGRYTISLLVAHGLLIVAGYALRAHVSLVSEVRTLVTGSRDVLLAVVGALLLVGVASARAVRRRVTYETWYYLHLVTYLAVAASFAHGVTTGAQFVAHPWARAAWSALYLSVAAAVIYWRIATPIYRSWRHRLRVSQIVPEAPGVVSVVLRGRHLAELNPQPGQFVRLRFLTRRRWWASHPFSLSAALSGDRIRVTVKALGDHTATMHRLEPGTRVLVAGPYGAFTAERRTRRKVLLLGGGIGITPLRALFQTMPAAAGDLTLIHRAERDCDLVFRDELTILAERRRQTVHHLPGPFGGPADVLVDGRLGRLVPDLPDHDVYVCGPPGFTAAALDALRRAGVPARQIHTETFAL